MIAIPTLIIKRVFYVGPFVGVVGLTLYVKDIVENETPVGAAKIILGRAVKKCTPLELLVTSKCVMLAGGVIATFATKGNPLAISAILTAPRLVVRP